MPSGCEKGVCNWSCINGHLWVLYAATRGARVGSLQEPAQLQLNIGKYVKKKKEKEKKLFVSVWLYCCSDDFVIQAQELNSNDFFKCTWMCT